MVLNERLLESSDAETVHVSAETGLVAVEDREQRRVYDPVTGDEDDIHELEVSYAFKLLLDEMIALGIRPKLELEDAILNVNANTESTRRHRLRPHGPGNVPGHVRDEGDHGRHV